MDLSEQTFTNFGGKDQTNSHSFAYYRMLLFYVDFLIIKLL